MTEPEELSYEWKEATFSLTVADVARMLGSTSQTVIDMMLAGQIGFYMAADPERETGLPIDCARFDPQDVTAVLQRDHERYASIALPVLRNLRHYLRTVPRTRVYDEAITRGRPIQTRAGLHVRIDAVVNHAIAMNVRSAAAKMRNTTEVAFERLGLVRVRSMTPYGDRQRWSTWHRLPEVIAFEGETLKIDSYLRPSGTLKPDEHLIEATDGSGPVVAQPLREDD